MTQKLEKSQLADNNKQKVDKRKDKPFHKCEQCDYKTVDRSNLTKHVKSVHQGIKYPCPHCDYKGSKENVQKNTNIVCTEKIIYVI